MQTQGDLQIDAKRGVPGEKKYLIQADWWRQWSDYVNFGAPTVQDCTSDADPRDNFLNELSQKKIKLCGST